MAWSKGIYSTTLALAWRCRPFKGWFILRSVLFVPQYLRESRVYASSIVLGRSYVLFLVGRYGIPTHASIESTPFVRTVRVLQKNYRPL